MRKEKRVRIIIGHYGSGKTEFSINYAIKLSKEFNKVALVDLDVVNPYFRSREQEENLKQYNIEMFSSNIKGLAADLPSVSGSILTAFQNENYEAIIDVGGDHQGARTLGRYEEYLTEGNYEMYAVINANRKETSTLEGVLDHIYRIEKTSRAKVTGLINNTHLLWETEVEDVLKGQELCKKVSDELNIPIKFVSAIDKVIERLPLNIEGEIIPIKMIMRKKWM